MYAKKGYPLPTLLSDCQPFLENCKFFKEDWPLERRGHKYVGYAIKDMLLERTTKFQDVTVFDSTSFGRVLAIGGTIQLTEFDEFTYHELLAFIPLASHSNPKKVLIVGGGDGGLVKEVLKFPTVENVTVCEIDKEIVEISETYFPSISEKIRHPKVTLVIRDGCDFLCDPNHAQKYDVIICDSSDPDETGPQESLMQEKFYLAMKNALTPGGIICSQLGINYWHREPVAEHVMSLCKRLFPVSQCLFLHVPSVTFCQNGCIISSNTDGVDFSQPKWKFSSEELDEMDIKFYNSSMHTAAFALPRFVEKYFNNLEEEMEKHSCYGNHSNGNHSNGNHSNSIH